MFDADGSFSTEINGMKFDVEVAICRGRTASAEVKEGTIRVRIPRSLAKNKKESLGRELYGKMHKRIEKHPEKFAYAKLSFFDGQEFDMLGKHYSMHIFYSQLGNRSSINGNDICIKLKAGKEDSGVDELANVAAKRALAKQAKPFLDEMVNRLNMQHFNEELRGVSISNANGRWGSYSKATKRIRINFKLLFVPEQVLQSVIVHELAHTKHLNHSHRFWKMVEGIMPDYKMHRKWLAANGNKITA